MRNWIKIVGLAAGCLLGRAGAQPVTLPPWPEFGHPSWNFAGIWQSTPLAAVGEVSGGSIWMMQEVEAAGRPRWMNLQRVYWCEGVFRNQATVKGLLARGEHRIIWAVNAAEWCAQPPGRWPRPAGTRSAVWLLRRNGPVLRLAADLTERNVCFLSVDWSPADTGKAQEEFGRLLVDPGASAAGIALTGDLLERAALAMTLTDPEWVLERSCEASWRLGDPEEGRSWRELLGIEYGWTCAEARR